METKKVIIKEEEVFLRKDWTGWRTIEPLKHPETGEILWKNFFSKKGFITLGFLLFLLFLGYMTFKEQLNNYQRVVNNPCEFCSDCQTYARDFANNANRKIELNFSNINITKP